MGALAGTGLAPPAPAEAQGTAPPSAPSLHPTDVTYDGDFAGTRVRICGCFSR